MSNFSRSNSEAEAEADPSGSSIPVDPRMTEKTIILSDNSKSIIYMFNNLYIYIFRCPSNVRFRIQVPTERRPQSRRIFK
jgi:hypothetical protein